MTKSLIDAKIELLCDKQPSSILLSGVAVLLLAFPFLGGSLSSSIFFWMGLSYLTLIFRAAVVFWLKKKKTDGQSFTKKHENIYATALFFNGVATTGIIYLIQDSPDTQKIFITYLFLLAILSGGIGRTNSSLRCSVSMILGFLGTATAIQFIPEPIESFYAIAFSVYGFFLFTTARQNSSQFKYQFNLLQERESHIKKLSKMIALEEELKQQKAMTHHLEKMASLGEMAGNIAHEINNPLTIIKGHTEVLNKKMRGMGDTEKNFQAIFKTIRRVAEIIENLKGFSRTSDENPQRKVDLRKVVQELVNLSGERMRTRGVELHLQNIRQVMIMGNHSSLLQVLMNLANNALHSIEPLENRQIDIEMVESEENCTVIVRDSGPGVPREIQHKIFDPYFSTKGPKEGTGLGLSICKKLINDMGGDIYLSPDNPSEFHIRLKRHFAENSQDIHDKAS